MGIRVIHAPSAGPLTQTVNADGFSVAGGTTPRMLTVTAANVTLNQSLQTTDTPRFLRVGIGAAADAALAVLVSGATSSAATVKVISTDNATSGTLGAYVNAVGGFFRAYGSNFAVSSLASKAAFGPDGATGIVVFSNSAVTSGGTGSISLRGGGYDTESERVFIDKDGVIISGKTQTTNVNALQVTQTWNAAGVTFTAMKLNVTNTNSAAASLLMDLQVAGTSQFKVDKSGAAVLTGSLTVAALAFVVFLGRSYLDSTADGLLAMHNNANTGFTSLAWHETTITRDAANILAQKNSTAAQEWRVYGTATGPKYLSLKHDGTNGIINNNSGQLRLAVGTISKISTGGAPTVGTATLVAGAVTITTTAATSTCIIILTRKTSGGTIGTAITYTISAGTSFTINSDNPLDTSVFVWEIVETY